MNTSSSTPESEDKIDNQLNIEADHEKVKTPDVKKLKTIDEIIKQTH